MWRIILIIISTLLTGLLLLSQRADAQNITDVRVDEVNCSHVMVSANIDPVSSTYTFSWSLSIDGGLNIEIVLVGLNGAGKVLTLDRGTNFMHTIENRPSFLPAKNDPFISNLTFMFDESANSNLVFKTVSTPLEINIEKPVSKPRCSTTFQNMDISCTDMTQNCFICGSDIPAVLTCPNKENFSSTCNENSEFDFNTCIQGTCTKHAIPNMRYKCTDGKKIGSICMLVCKKGYDLKGVNQTVCKETGFLPSPKSNQCKQKTCTKYPVPNMRYKCTKGKKFGSICNLVCKKGYDLKGVNQTVCEETGFQPSPKSNKCKRTLKTCTKHPVSNMIYNCTKGKKFGSICNLVCKKGYDLKGVNQTVCEDTGFQPSPKSNECKRKIMAPKRQCNPQKILKMQNAILTIVCKNGYALGSRCQFKCETGYRLTGHPCTYCTEDGFKPFPLTTRCIECEENASFC